MVRKREASYGIPRFQEVPLSVMQTWVVKYRQRPTLKCLGLLKRRFVAR